LRLEEKRRAEKCRKIRERKGRKNLTGLVVVITEKKNILIK